MCLVIVLCPTPTTFTYIYIIIYIYTCCFKLLLNRCHKVEGLTAVAQWLYSHQYLREHFSSHSYRRAPSKQSNSPQFITWAICIYIYIHVITYFITIHLTMTSSLHIITQNPSYAKHLNGHIRSQRNHMAQGMAPIASSSITSYRIRHLHLLQAIP